MSIRRKFSAVVITLSILGLSASPASAHRRWLLPSATVLSGDSETVTVDAAASNGLFLFEHRAMPLDDLIVIGPDGEPVDVKIIGSGAYRSSFDVPLVQQGSYRIGLVSSGVMGFYKLGDERQRWQGTIEQLDTAFPKGASDINVFQVASRVETFVTLGEPNTTALAATGKGLEMVPVTHPNDLVVGETAHFQLLIDGVPAPGIEVDWVKGGTRYRNVPGDKKIKADADGMIEITVDQPGMYYLETGIQDNKTASAKVASRRASYIAVLEFLPE